MKNLKIPTQHIDDGHRASSSSIASRLTRAALAVLGCQVERPDSPEPSSRAERVVLPMSSGASILPHTSAQITSRPQRCAFLPKRIIIAGDPGHWIINDIRINGRSQLAQSGDLPGEVFAANAVGTEIDLEVVHVDDKFIVLVTYVGPLNQGAPFVCGVLGEAVPPASAQREEKISQVKNLRAMNLDLSSATIRRSDRGRGFEPPFMPMPFMPMPTPSILRRIIERIVDRVTIAGLALLGYEVAPPPRSTHRITLPMSSGVHILPNTSAQVTSRPQTHAFRPERVVIGGTPGHWVVNDIKVGNRSQFAQSGDVPGEMFAFDAIDSSLIFDTVHTAMDFVILVTYIGPEKSGEPFICGALGTTQGM